MRSVSQSSHLDNPVSLIEAFRDHRPAGIEPEAQAAIADVAAAEPEQAGFDWRMTQQEIVILGHEDQAVLFDMGSDGGVGRLATQLDADMLRDQAALLKPSAKGGWQLRVDQKPHQAACTTV